MADQLEPLRPYLEQLEVCIRSAFDMALQLEEEQQKLEEQLRAFKEAITERERRLTSLRAALEECRNHRSRLEQELEAANRDKRALGEEVEKLRAGSRALEERVRTLERQLNQATLEQKQRQRRWKW
ncbi:MAG: hypothetical protein AB1446_03845 [Bacillota bacterium]